MSDSVSITAWRSLVGACAGSVPAERLVFIASGEPGCFTVTDNEEVVISREDVDQIETIDAIRGFLARADFRVPPLRFDGRPGTEG